MALFNALKTKFKNFVIVIYTLSILSCYGTNTDTDGQRNSAILESTKVSKLLEKVIAHYDGDTDAGLKIEAAKFLTSNMKGLYYYDGEALNNHLQYLELINRDREKGLHIMKFLNDRYGNFSVNSLNKYYYTDITKPKDIIENIDMAFKVWRGQPWGKDISFGEFCEYILPFQVGDEIPENNRREIYEKFSPLIDSVVKTGGSAKEVCIFLNERLKKEGWLFSNKIGFLPHFSSSTLLKYRTGSCRDMTSMTIFIMRAVGIPVGTDITPQWAYRNGDHIWNTLKDKENSVTAFMGTDESPGIQHKPCSKRGKVYRNTYAINLETLAMKKGENDVVPEFFENPRLKDVTEEYSKVSELEIPVLFRPVRNGKFAYACLFDDTEWKPVHWAYANTKMLKFSKMATGAIYLPTFYKHNGTMMPAGYPVILKNDGSSLPLKPDSIKRHKRMVLKRAYSIIPEKFQVKNFSGHFELADLPGFRNATIVNISGQILPYLNTLQIESSKSFRYIWFVPAKGRHCSIGELEIYSSGQKRKTGLLTSKSGTPADSTRSALKAIDGDLSTFFESKFSDKSWFGVGLKQKLHIDSIKFSVPYDGLRDRIEAETEYELFYWNGGGQWVSMGTKKSRNYSEIIFEDVPSNALYRLVNISTKTTGRIFTYQNNQQIWW